MACLLPREAGRERREVANYNLEGGNFANLVIFGRAMSVWSDTKRASYYSNSELESIIFVIIDLQRLYAARFTNV